MPNDKEQIPQRKLGTALRSFFNHVTSHDEEGVHAALCLVANEASQDPNAPVDSMHVCYFGAGDPDTLAQLVLMAIDAMVEEVPGFEKAFRSAVRAERLQSMANIALSAMRQAEEQAAEAKGMEAVKPEVDALIEKLKSNPGAVPGPDTEQ